MRLHEAARQYLEVPFAHQGRDPSIAIDCIGLGVLACRDCGLPVPDWVDYAVDYRRDPHGNLLRDRMRSVFGDPLPLEQMQAGDIVAIFYGGPLRHLGIVGERDYAGTTHLTLIHTDSRIGMVVEHRIDEGWMGRKRPAIGEVYRPQVVA